uniref:Uncharacterized protein n=1 Tax=Meloidogyne enterolobii TaxID=390850 RepID=A0A6V7UII9_MELEN|nr:unnamed protein product [Meloidogyne enterolobii]
MITGEASSSNNNNINQLWSDPIFVQQFKIHSIEESKKFRNSILSGNQSNVHSNQQIVESNHYKIPDLNELPDNIENLSEKEQSGGRDDIIDLNLTPQNDEN